MLRNHRTCQSGTNLVPCRCQTEDLGSSSGIEGKAEGGTCRHLAPSVLVLHVYLFTSILGKSCQLRFWRLGGVMSWFRFSSNHWDQTLWWLGFKMVMPNSSEIDKMSHYFWEIQKYFLDFVPPLIFNKKRKMCSREI